ncbi:MAG TPA: hypothetical protein VFQ54_11030 [Thermomicrobiales bacterium]|nr:hypothetical protein [Thermomicrobiales bacterium]
MEEEELTESFTNDSHTMLQATSEVLAFFEPRIRAEERRAVIEELAREAEAGFYDEDLIFEHADWSLSKQEGHQVAAWLRSHANCGESATIGEEEG